MPGMWQARLENLRYTWRLFRRKRMGVAGLTLVAIFSLMALLAPLISGYDPIKSEGLAETIAPPSWVTLLGWGDLPPNLTIVLDSKMARTSALTENTGKVRVEHGEALVVRYQGTGTRDVARILITYPFRYEYEPPKSYTFTMPIVIETPTPFEPGKGRGVLTSYTINLTRPGGRQFYLADGAFSRANITVKARSDDFTLIAKNRLGELENFAVTTLSRKGEYRVTVAITFTDLGGSEGSAQVVLKPATLQIRGRVFGLLGTDYRGGDVWSQFVWGSRVSLTVGFMVAALVLGLGVPIGLIAGYRPGWTDRLLMFAADFLYLLPGLPLILLIILIFGRNLYLMVFLISLVSWSGLARTVRSWTLSLRERPFVESGRVVGLSDITLLFKYILPQMAPYLMYTFVTAIPGAVLFEAGLSILGLGDPFQPSWGKMINESLFQGGVIQGAWWWVLPPILGLILLSLGFVFIGFTLDEILNPRLRRR